MKGTDAKASDESSETEETEETEESSEGLDDEKPTSVRAPRKEPVREAEPLRFSATTVAAVAILVAAGAFAAGRSMTPSASESPTAAEKPAQGGAGPMAPSLGGGGGMGGGPNEALPPGHPPTGDLPPNAGSGAGLGLPGAGAVEPAALAWKAPARWQLVPNASTMRLATYRIPHAPGDSEDPELTITQAGGTVEANMQRWMGQFGAEGAKTAKRSNRTVKPFEIALVEVEGKFASGMGKEGREEDQWAMLGAIVQTPGMPHFFKLTGPAKSVKAAKAEFDSLVGSVTPK